MPLGAGSRLGRTRRCSAGSEVKPRRIPTGAELHNLQDCLCLALRRTTRIVTQRYDAALRPFGIRVTQLPILTAAASGDGVPLTPLAEGFGMDRTTLLRNVRPLARRGLVDVRRAVGHRHDELHATAKGRRLLARAYPAWRQVQDEVRAEIRAPAFRQTLRAIGSTGRKDRRG